MREFQTYGNTPALIAIQNFVDQGVLPSRKTGRFLANFSITFKTIAGIPDREIRLFLAELALTKFKENINKCRYFEGKRSYFHNALKYFYRKCIKGEYKTEFIPLDQIDKAVGTDSFWKAYKQAIKLPKKTLD